MQGESFPFLGYDAVLDAVARHADLAPGLTALDVGVGTGNLARCLLDAECHVWGVDFSSEMLARVRTALPQVITVQADLLASAWPPVLDQRFHRIVSGYVFHEFVLPAKRTLIERLVSDHLTGEGRLVIGDIAFPTLAVREAAHARWQDMWDEDETYWAADEALAALSDRGLAAVYEQISPCAGVFVISAQ